MCRFLSIEMFSPDYAQLATKVLKTPFLTSNPIGKYVDDQISEYFGVKHAKCFSRWPIINKDLNLFERIIQAVLDLNVGRACR